MQTLRDRVGKITGLSLNSFTIQGRLRRPLPTPSTTASATPTPSTTASATPTPSTTASATPTPSTTASATPTPSSSPSPTPTPSSSPSPTPTPSSSPSPTPTSSLTPTPSTTASSTPTATMSPTPTNTASLTPSPTQTKTPTQTPSPTPTNTPSSTPFPTQTPSPTPLSVVIDIANPAYPDNPFYGANPLDLVYVTLADGAQKPGEVDTFYYYNEPSFDPFSNPTGFMSIFIGGTLRAEIVFTPERLGTYFGYSITGTEPYFIGVFSEGIVSFDPTPIF